MANDNPQGNERWQEGWVDEQMAKLQGNAEWEPDADRGVARLRASQMKRSRKRRMATMAGVAVLAVGSLAAAFPTTRAFAEQCADACGNGLMQMHNALLNGQAHRALYA